MRAAPLLFLLSLAATSVLAQSSPGTATSTVLAPPTAHETSVLQAKGAEPFDKLRTPPSTSAAPPLPEGSRASGSGASPSQGDKNNQRTQRIHIEDKGSRVDEVRIGGQTKSITVTPKVGKLPTYEVQPTDDANNRNRSSSGTTGPRVWNLHKF